MSASNYSYNAALHQLRADIAGLRAMLEEQADEIHRLKALLRATGHLFVDLELIEKEALAYHLESARSEAERTRGVPPPPEAEEECSECHRIVPGNEISYTDVGRLCDLCYVRRQADGHEDPEV